GFAAIAARADVPLADLRGEFNTTLEILAAFMRETDRKVLAGVDPELAEEPARERLFDVVMRRIEILKPQRAAIRSLARSARRDPPLALALNRLSLRSQKWMLTAAGINSAGLSGHMRAQGLVVVMARTLNVWFEDDDPGLARTMAALDRQLANGERMLNLFDDLCRLVPRFGSSRRRRRRGDSSDTVAA
ncbi:MAG: TetR/AcrR family transcriptional regulator, partial [Xanthobacteraceae bacterium]